MATEIVVLNLDRVTKKLDKLETGLRGPLIEAALDKALGELVDESDERVPEWRGELKDSIEGLTSRRGDTVEGIYRVGAEHGIYQEMGTPGPRFVPAQYIGEWAQDHGFGYTGLVVSGKAQPFVRRNENETLGVVAERVADRTIDLIEQGIRAIL